MIVFLGLLSDVFVLVQAPTFFFSLSHALTLLQPFAPARRNSRVSSTASGLTGAQNKDLVALATANLGGNRGWVVPDSGPKMGIPLFPQLKMGCFRSLQKRRKKVVRNLNFGSACSSASPRLFDSLPAHPRFVVDALSRVGQPRI